MLMLEIECAARSAFTQLQLHADTERGARSYETRGYQ